MKSNQQSMQSVSAGNRLKTENYYIRLTPWARFFYREWLLNPEASRYNIVFDQILHGNLDKERLQSACYRYVSEHLLLNSCIKVEKDIPYWVSNKTVYSMTYEQSIPKEEDILAYVAAPFDLHSGPLYRVKLIAVTPGVYRFILVLHHLLVDGLSVDRGVFSSLSKYYNDRNYTASIDSKTQAEKLIALEKKLSCSLESQHKDSEDFWQSQLSGIETISLDFLQTATYRTEPDHSQNSLESIEFSYHKDDIQALKTLKKQYELSIHTYGLTVFALLLHRYTNLSRFAISFPVAIKGGIPFIFGAQLNINLIPYRFDELKTAAALAHYTRSFFKQLKNSDTHYSSYPIEEITKHHNHHLLNICYSQTSIKSTCFDFDGIESVERITTSEVDFITQDNFLFEQEMYQGGLNCRVRYNPQVLDRKLIQNFVKVYQRLFFELAKALIQSPQKALATFCIIEPEDYAHLVASYYRWPKSTLNTALLHQRFESKAKKYPDRTAVVAKNTFITYQAINQKSNKLARYLLSLKPEKSSPYIAIFMEKGEKMITAILSVLKLGCTYVPIDVKQSDERICYILQDVQVALAVTCEEYSHRLSSMDLVVVSVDQLNTAEALDRLSENNLNQPITAEDPSAYVIYTSGTTGNPKGVLQTHSNVLRLFDSVQSIYDFNDQDVWMLLHAPFFDFSVWEIWGALLYGGKLVIPTSEQTMDIRLLCELCIDERITVLNQTPQLFYQLSQHIIAESLQGVLFPHLRYIIFGGERLDFFQLTPWFSGYNGTPSNPPKLINMYGITETTIHSSYKVVSSDDVNQKSIIGRPLPHQKFYILNEKHDLVPVGVVGELYIGGYGLAAKYINNPLLTAEKFIPNPFQTEEEIRNQFNTRLYKTGDLVRRLTSGEIIYMGRCDSQVKNCGFRIELEAIKARLLNYPDVKAAVVMKKSLNGDSIVAYYVADGALDREALAEHMQADLPYYMCPTLYVHLTQIPLTPNNKIDFKALPDPHASKTQSDYEEPQNDLEQRICDAFSSVLGLRKIGVSDDFFQLGGNSLKAIQLVALLQRYFHVNIAQIFKTRTPRSLSATVKRQSASFNENMVRIKSLYQTEPLPLTQAYALKKQLYFDSIRAHTENKESKPKLVQTVLLTGATGYLGSYLLDTLLHQTQHTVYVLVRGFSEEQAVNRLMEKYCYYFGKSIEPLLYKRLFVMKSDLTQPYLGLSTEKQYYDLAGKVDAIIHAAALVKHYGQEHIFYEANVKTTEMLLAFSKLTSSPNFHYISTISVCYMDDTNPIQQKIYTEEDLPSQLRPSGNIYVKTKLYAERAVIDAQKEGVTVHIYRIGNLAFDSKGLAQQNSYENAFSHYLQYAYKIKCLTKSISEVEISLVDYTANAIVKLFDQNKNDALQHPIYHVFNPYKTDLISALKEVQHNLSILPINEFIDHISYNFSQHDQDYSLLLKFLLHLGWLEGEINPHYSKNIQVLQSRTQAILKSLDFNWDFISLSTFRQYIQHLFPSYETNMEADYCES